MSKSSKGLGYIKSALGTVQKLIDKVAMGIELCQQEVVENEDTIMGLTDTNKDITLSLEQAKKLKENLSKLLS